MTAGEEALCLAMILGDGYVLRDCSRLRLSHSVHQKDYLIWKAAILERITGNSARISEVTHKGPAGKEYPGVQLGISHEIFTTLREECYREGKPFFSRETLNRLTPEAIAIWYMDDGSLYSKKRGGKIHAYELVLSICTSEELALTAKEYFAQVLGVNFTIKRNKGFCSIRCGTREARKFVELVKPFVPSCMEYKITFSAFNGA